MRISIPNDKQVDPDWLELVLEDLCDMVRHVRRKSGKQQEQYTLYFGTTQVEVTVRRISVVARQRHTAHHRKDAHDVNGIATQPARFVPPAERTPSYPTPADLLTAAIALPPPAVPPLVVLPELAPYFVRYAAVNAPEGGVALRVICHLREGARVAGYDPINLDNLLARAVLEEATSSSGVPDQQACYALPVPLRCLWLSREGLPLWATTPLLPAGERVPDVTYWHKRAQSGVWTGVASGRFTLAPTNGRYMERRVPLPTTVCHRLEATAIGHPQEILRLLQRIAWLGKKRHAGMGEIDRWEVAPLAERFRVLDATGRLTRTLPVNAWLAAQAPPGVEGHAPALAALLAEAPYPAGVTPAPLGWTPPQWKSSLWELGWTLGTTVLESAQG